MNVGDIPLTDLVVRTWEQTLLDTASGSVRAESIRQEFATRLKSIIEADSDEDSPARRNSVQSRAHNLLGNAYLDSSLINQLFFRQRTEVDVPPYGYLQRDLIMRRLFPLTGNSIVQAAVAIMVQKIQACEYVIEGPSRTAKGAKALIQGSDLGFGWEAYLSKWAQDYLTQDNGAFTEIIWDDGVEDEYINNGPAPGASIVGFAHLDAVRCRRTGDPDHPIIYQALTGDMHKMHRSRVIVSADLVNPNERFLGRGFCAFSRVLAMAQTLVRYEKYRVEMLDDVPPLGLLILQNINRAEWDKQDKGFQSQRLADEQYYFSNILKLFNADPSKPADAKLIPFKNLWENFDERNFYDVALDLVAMGFGLDRQDLAPLTTASMGTAAQSNVLNAKGQGKGIGNMLTVVERNMNQLLPSSCTFKFDYHDQTQDSDRAQIRDAKAKTIIQLYVTNTKAPTGMQGAVGAQAPGAQQTPGAVDQATDDDRLISKDEARRILVREVPEWADIITVSNPEDEVQFDDTDDEPLTPSDTGEPVALQPSAIQKMIDRRYGPVVKVWKSGKVTCKRREPPITQAEREKARKYLSTLVMKDSNG